MEELLFHRRRMFSVGFSFIFWILFIYIWGYLAWNDAQLGTKEWWFDLAGHYLAGTVCAWNLFFVLRNFISPRHSFRLLENSFQGVWVFILTLLVAWMWEVYEGSLDLYRVLSETNNMPAQTHALDTTADLVTTTIAAIPVIIFYIKTTQYFSRRFPDEHLRDEYVRFELLGEEMARNTRTHSQHVRRALFKNFQKGVSNVLREGSKKHRGKHKKA